MEPDQSIDVRATIGHDRSSRLAEVRRLLADEGLSAFILPSADEELNEFPPPGKRRLAWLTGFTGSMGLGLIAANAGAVSVDGRYAAQAARQAGPDGFDIIGALPGDQREWLQAKVPAGGRIGYDPHCHSASEAAAWRELTGTIGLELVPVSPNPVDRVWRDSDRISPARIVDYPVAFAGASRSEKIASVGSACRGAGAAACFIADPEDIAWLLNVRLDPKWLDTPADDWHIVPSVPGPVIVFAEGNASWCVGKDDLSSALRGPGEPVALATVQELDAALKHLAGERVLLNLNRTPAAWVSTMTDAGISLSDDEFVARRRWTKHPAEVAGARAAHVEDAVAVIRFMAALPEAASRDGFDEINAAAMLATMRRDNPLYLGPSMPFMSASGPNGALPHYVPQPSTTRALADHPIYWMDSGGQYLGGSTDNTITIALGSPEPRHVLAHTLVLKGYIALARAVFPIGTRAFELDSFARQFLWRHGMDYAHGTGHGVGSYLNIHEGPHISNNPARMGDRELAPGMISSNEPGFYVDGDFGIRIESHITVVPAEHPGFLRFDTLSRLPIDPALVDPELLTGEEARWLSSYHDLVVDEVGPRLDPPAREWLVGVADAFRRMARHSS